MNGMRLRGTPQEASCMEVGRRIQSYLDGELDERTARRIAAHLVRCRRCGMKEATYAQLKMALARRSGRDDELALRRLGQFANDLAAGRVPLDPPTRM